MSVHRHDWSLPSAPASNHWAIRAGWSTKPSPNARNILPNAPSAVAGESQEAAARSTVIDRLFVGDSEDKVSQMRDALAALPPDAYALKTLSAQMALEAK